MERCSHARRLAGSELAAALRDSRRRTLGLVEDLSDAQWLVPQRAGLNPIAWELAHIAWFAEFWVLRGPHEIQGDGLAHAARPPRHAGPDELFDSGRLSHARRWKVVLPPRARVLEMLCSQLDACLQALPPDDSDDALYFHRLALLHEDMHAEALTWLRASLGYPAPAGQLLPAWGQGSVLRFGGGVVRVGRPAEASGFHFDNEVPAFERRLAAYQIDAAPVTFAQYLAFVEDGGYEREAFWTPPGWHWRREAKAQYPVRWRFTEAGWQHRWFDRWEPLPMLSPVVHVNAWEAGAFACWAGARLPSAAEWEHAARAAQTAQGEGARMLWGQGVWEWTSDAFQPYPGFQAGPYRAYSAPWFGDHRELRGGSFATHARLHEPVYRNFFRPERQDVFAGFRTAS